MRKFLYTLPVILSVVALIALASYTSDLFQEVEAQVTDWQNSGDDIYYDAGKVGVNTSTPTSSVYIQQETSVNGFQVKQTNASNANMIKAEFAGGNVGGTGLGDSLIRLTSNSGFRNLMSLESPNDVFLVGAGGRLKLGANNYYAVIDGKASTWPLNPGYTSSATRIIGRNDGHVLIDVLGNDPQDAFAVRTSSDGDSRVDRIVFKASADGNVCIGKCY